MAHSLHEFKVNGRAVRLNARDDAPLLTLLRNDLGLKGAKFGCGAGLCGACAVIVDGVAQPSCTLPVSAVAGKDVATVEGLLAADDRLLQAFVAEGAAQCGYCTAGILMAAKALLDSVPTPSREEIVAALEGHLCRCGVHQRIIAAVARAAGDAK